MCRSAALNFKEVPQPVFLQMTQRSVMEQQGPAASQGKASQEWCSRTVTSPYGARIQSGKSSSGSGPETVARARCNPAITWHGHQDEAGPSSAGKPGLSPGQGGGHTCPSMGVAVTWLRYSPGRGWQSSHSWSVVAVGREKQGLAFTLFTTLVTKLTTNSAS